MGDERHWSQALVMVSSHLAHLLDSDLLTRKAHLKTLGIDSHEEAGQGVGGLAQDVGDQSTRDVAANGESERGLGGYVDGEGTTAGGAGGSLGWGGGGG